MNSSHDGEIRVLKIHVNDNVAVALGNFPAGSTAVILTESEKPGVLVLKTNVPFAHKVSLEVIGAGSPVVKYGQTIGEATTDIAAGEHVHIDNVRSLRGRAK